MRSFTGRIFHGVAIVALLVSTTGCDRIAEGSNTAAAVTKKSFYDARDTWVDVFTYHPKQPDQAPQTRYCYQTQSDVVCYDSVQTRLTSKLVGYQDGEHISWVQPGGGSLGVSGGEPFAARIAASASMGRSSAGSQSASMANSTATVIDVPQPGSISSSRLAPPTSQTSTKR